MSVDDADTDDLLEQVTAMADRMGLEGRDKRDYIHEHMTRSGYRAEPTYVREEPEESDRDGDKGSGFFRSKGADRDRGRGNRSDRGSRDRDRGTGKDWYE